MSTFPGTGVEDRIARGIEDRLSGWIWSCGLEALYEPPPLSCIWGRMAERDSRDGSWASTPLQAPGRRASVSRAGQVPNIAEGDGRGRERGRDENNQRGQDHVSRPSPGKATW